jgi:glycerate 2-kinase
MTLTRAVAESAFVRAVIACDPTRLVREAIMLPPTLALAVGKAALAMARGAGPVTRGLAIAPADDGRGLPSGWHLMVGAHPVPDQRSLAAGDAALSLFEAATPNDLVLALISGGASSLMEMPRVPFEDYRELTSAVMAAGADISVLNLVRTALSNIKGGGLVAGCAARVITLAISDVVGDDLAVIGSGPTISPTESGNPAARALVSVRMLGIEPPVLVELASRPYRAPATRIGDIARVVGPMRAFSSAAAEALGDVRVLEDPLAGEIESCAARLAAKQGALVAWGEPTLIVPEDHGEGGRSQQLALLLARAMRGTDRAALVVGSDGVDGPAPAHRPAPAGAFVDGATWDAILAAGLDPEAALARRDAGTVLHVVGALVVTGPTGINHADLVIVG